MQPAVQARYQMVLVAIKMITREFKDGAVIWNGLGRNMSKKSPQTIFPGARSLSLCSNTRYVIKYMLYIYSVSKKCQSA